MEKISQFNTDFLFSTPTYLSGAANIFNIGGNFYDYNSSKTEVEADCKAIRNDFKMVGIDLEKATLEVMGKK